MEQIELQKHIANLTSEEFHTFISELGMIPLISIDEELELVHRIRKGGADGAQAKELLATSNLRYIYSVAKQHEHHGLSLQDLFVCGITGLLKATEKYDETQGFKFLSYAIWWIRESMLHTIKKCDANVSQG